MVDYVGVRRLAWVRSWYISELLNAAFDGRLRLQDGLRKVVQRRVYEIMLWGRP